MTIKEMLDELENKVRDTYIVTLKYKYYVEENYTIENHILEYESTTDSYVWLDDWYEGQTDVEVLGYMLLGDVDTTKLLTCEDCISREALENAIDNLIYLHFKNERLLTAYELGMQTSFEEWLASFNADSATECFTAVQELKKKIKEGER